MILKAGTYRFNDVLGEFPEIDLGNAYDYFIPISFNYNGKEYLCMHYGWLAFEGGAPLETLTFMETYIEVGEPEPPSITIWGNQGGDIGNGYVVETPVNVTIHEDTDVKDAFGTWYIANTDYNEVNRIAYAIKPTTLLSIANAIRSKRGITYPILTENMADEILAIETGSGEYPDDFPTFQKWKFNDTQTFATTDANNPTLRVQGDFIINGKYCEYFSFTYTDTGTRKIEAWVRDKVSVTGSTLGTQSYTVYEYDGITTAWLEDFKEFYILDCNNLVTSQTNLASFGCSTVDEFMSKVSTKIEVTPPETTDESIVGTWVFNDTITQLTSDVIYNITFECNGTQYNKISNYWSGNAQLFTYYIDSKPTYAYTHKFDSWSGDYQTITIRGGTDIANETFAKWLKANATKQESIVGIWRFNETLVDRHTFDVPCEFYYYAPEPYSSVDPHFYRMLVVSDGRLYFGYAGTGGFDTYDYDNNEWKNGSLKTPVIIEIITEPTDKTFISWLKANATKIG